MATTIIPQAGALAAVTAAGATEAVGGAAGELETQRHLEPKVCSFLFPF